RDNDHGVRPYGADQPAHLAIDGRNLAVVRRGGESAFQVDRRIVRVVRIVKMDPEKERGAISCRPAWGLGPQPGDRTRDHLLASTLDGVIAVFARKPEAVTGVVHVETAIETGRGTAAGIEDQRSDERSRPVTLLPEQLGQVRDRAGQRGTKIADAMKRRVRAR